MVYLTNCVTLTLFGCILLFKYKKEKGSESMKQYLFNTNSEPMNGFMFPFIATSDLGNGLYEGHLDPETMTNVQKILSKEYLSDRVKSPIMNSIE